MKPNRRNRVKDAHSQKRLATMFDRTSKRKKTTPMLQDVSAPADVQKCAELDERGEPLPPVRSDDNWL